MSRPALSRRPVPEGIRITRVGLFYVLFTLVVGVAATNTGNNALYLALAVMLGLLAASGLLSRANVRRLEVEVAPPEEVFAGSPFRLPFALRNRSRRRARRLLVLWVADRRGSRLVPHLPANGVGRGHLEMNLPRRGAHPLPWAHLTSLFPLGLFQKGMRLPLAAQVLVFPRLLDEAPLPPGTAGWHGEEAAGRAGWGHELLSLRFFRPGDDARRLHWKQSARTGSLIVTEREAEEGRRVAILCDNAVGELAGPGEEARFERLVSEAATAACRYLEQGLEVELVTRAGTLPFAGGPHQRRRILEELAVLAPAPREPAPLAGSDPAVPALALVLPPATEGV